MIPLPIAQFRTLICLYSLVLIPITLADNGSFAIVAHSSQQISENLSLGGGLTASGNISSINDVGRVVFPSSIITPESTTGSALFSWEAGELQELVRTGSAAPSNGTFNFLNDPIQNNTGAVVFGSSLEATTGGDTDNTGVFWIKDNEIKEILRKGQALPVTSSAPSNGFGRGVFINDSDQVLLALNFDDSQETDIGLFLWDGTGLTKVIRNGDPLPENSSLPANNTVFSALGFANNIDFNNQGEVTFDAMDDTIYRGLPGAIVEVTKLQSRTGNLFLNDSGLLAFVDALGVYTNASDSTDVVTIADRNTPAFQEGDSFSSFTEIRLAQSGAIAFKAGLNSDAGFRVGLYLAKDGEIVEIFRAITQSEFGTLGPKDPSTFTEFAITETGQVVYEASLRNGNNAIFISDGTTTTRIAQGPILEPFGRPRFPQGQNVTPTGQILLESPIHPAVGAQRHDSLVVYSPPPPSSQIQSVSVNDGEIVLTVRSATGSTYQLQIRNNASPFSWSNLDTPKVGTGATLEFRHPISDNNTAQLYRIQTLSSG